MKPPHLKKKRLKTRLMLKNLRKMVVLTKSHTRKRMKKRPLPALKMNSKDLPRRMSLKVITTETRKRTMQIMRIYKTSSKINTTLTGRIWMK